MHGTARGLRRDRGRRAVSEANPQEAKRSSPHRYQVGDKINAAPPAMPITERDPGRVTNGVLAMRRRRRRQARRDLLTLMA